MSRAPTVMLVSVGVMAANGPAWSSANGTVRIEIEGVRVPSGGLVVRSPLDRSLRGATLPGRTVSVRDSEVVLRALPASLVFRY